MKRARVPSFAGLNPSSEAASVAKRGNVATDTRPELRLRRALFARGGRYRLHVRSLPGNPDLVFVAAKVVVFCDGDFWHGNDWRRRRARLAAGANAGYWVAKIEANRRRDQRHVRSLRRLGWEVIRVWETDIHRDPDDIATMIMRRVESRRR